jgi:hypothetical protein
MNVLHRLYVAHLTKRRYCQVCGSPMGWAVWSHSYDSRTGAKTVYWAWQCLGYSSHHDGGYHLSLPDGVSP